MTRRQDSHRTAETFRQTGETKVRVTLNLDGSGKCAAESGVGFFDHMLNLLARHSLIDLDIHAEGDLAVDAHHTVEDVGIVLGQCLEQALGEKQGIHRYGWAIIPMDEALAQVAIDLSGRTAVVFDAPFTDQQIGTFPVELVEEFFRAFAQNSRMNLHIKVQYGSNNHHIAEAIFKAVARALRQAVTIDPRSPGVPSTKGSLKG